MIVLKLEPFNPFPAIYKGNCNLNGSTNKKADVLWEWRYDSELNKRIRVVRLRPWLSESNNKEIKMLHLDGDPPTTIILLLTRSILSFLQRLRIRV